MRASAPCVLLAAFIALSPGVVVAQGDLGVENRALIGEPEGRPLVGDELDQTTEEVASLMRCPVCQGLSVADSPTVSAQAMKAEVRVFLAAGYTHDQILTYFEHSYGEFIRLEPRAEGFNLLVWIAPIAALILGLTLVVRYLKRRPSDPRNQPSAEEETELAAYLERVRREVAS